jgi:hypothetical protein
MENKIRWVIQNNLIAENELNQLQEACNDANAEFEEVLIIPFAYDLPKFKHDSNNVYYGSTTFMNNIYRELKPKGLFYDADRFSMSNYFNKWGNHMLNNGATVSTVAELLDSDSEYHTSNEVRFVRPDGDGKEFDGQTSTIPEIKEMLKRTLLYEGPLTRKSRIVVGSAYNIHKEWRLYIVGGRIVSASKYRENFKLSKSNLDIPKEMITFAEERIKEYTPHDNFAMDICSVHDGTYYIIECGCLNSVGFYHADIKEIVKAITEWMKT